MFMHGIHVDVRDEEAALLKVLWCLELSESRNLKFKITNKNLSYRTNQIATVETLHRKRLFLKKAM